MKLYEIVYEKKYSWPRGVASVARPECYDQQMPAHLPKWQAWQIRVTDNVLNQSGFHEWAWNIKFTRLRLS